MGQPTNPPVLLLPELPGMTHEYLALAQRVSESGYAVYLPQLFGKLDRSTTFPNWLHVVSSRDWAPYSKNKTSAIILSLRKLVRALEEQHSKQSMAVIGMCLTGTLPIALLTEPNVKVAVCSQPATPLFTAFSKSRQAALNLYPKDLYAARSAAATNKAQILVFRFEKDKMSPAARFSRITNSFTGCVTGKVIEACEYKHYHLKPNAHSVLTHSYSNEAHHPTRECFEQMMRTIDCKLKNERCEE
jgi:dienelactone hydrolase